MALYSYVVVRDYGFAPNPFHGYCTLATCKHVTRRVANVGDWVVGTGSAQRHRTGQLICAMRVTERTTFDVYWADPRFALKKPDLTGSRMRAYGDNIYHHDQHGEWVQEDSHHSLPGGQINPVNLDDDTKTDQVLISSEFWYFGRDAPLIPAQFRGIGTENICASRGHRTNFTPEFVEGFLDWVRQHEPGCIGRPDRWP
jgi:Nucleotide modification associated domain 2